MESPGKKKDYVISFRFEVKRDESDTLARSEPFDVRIEGLR